MLSPYRVLDLTDHRGQLAGAILASLGADVVLIEPPEGSPGRKQGPFHGELSLSWWAYNGGKRSAVVDLASDHFRDLLAGADVVIESGLGSLDRSAVAAANPALIHVTVSPFGLDGPKAAWPASDLTIMASACQLALTGDGDRAPLRTAVPQAWLHAGAEAAAATVLALVERARSGRGQRRAGSPTDSGRPANWPSPVAFRLPPSRRLRVHHAQLQQSERPLYGPADAVRTRGRSLRQRHARRRLDRLCEPATHRRTTAVALRTGQGGRGQPDRQQTQGRSLRRSATPAAAVGSRGEHRRPIGE